MAEFILNSAKIVSIDELDKLRTKTTVDETILTSLRTKFRINEPAGFANTTSIWIHHMTRGETSIHDLDQNARNAVIHIFATAIGASSAFAKAGVSGEVLDTETLAELLALRKWPSAETTAIELAWLSQPITSDEVQELDGYSVFWATADDGFQIWIGRTPFRPPDWSAYLRNADLLLAIVETYGFYVSHEQRRDHRRALLKWRTKRTLYPIALFLVAPVVMAMILLEGRDWEIERFALSDASLLVVYGVGTSLGYSLLRWGGPTVSPVVHIVLLLVGAAFLSIASEWIEGTELLGLSAACAAGFYVTIWKNRDLLSLSTREVADGRFQSAYAIAATWSVVTATVFGAFQVLAYAIDGAFVQGNVFLGFLIIVVVLAVAEFIRSQMAK